MKRRHRKPTLIAATAAGAALSLLYTFVGFALPEPLPDPFHPDASPLELLQFTVDSRSATGTSVTLPKGAYRLVATGFYTYAGPAGGPYKADAECSIFYGPMGTSAWARNQYGNGGLSSDPLDLLVDGQAVEWSPTKGSATGTPAGPTANKGFNPECNSSPNSTDHEYWYPLDWPGGSLNLRIFEGILADNAGVLTVTIQVPASRVKEELVSVVTVPATLQSGVDSPPLVVGQTYRLEVSGVYTYAPGRNVTADSECSVKPTNQTWLAKFDPNMADDRDILDLHVDDGPYNGWADGDVSWIPLTSPTQPGTCAADPDRTYQYFYQAQDPLGTGARDVTKLNLRVWDSDHLDNRGLLTVKIFHVIDILQQPTLDLSPDGPPSLSGLPVDTPDLPTIVPDAAASVPDCVQDSLGACIFVSVPSNAPEGVFTPAVPPGKYLLEVSGVYEYETGIKADAECSTGPLAFVVNSDPTWQRNRYALSVPGRDPLDLMVDDREVEWRPKGSPNALGCQDSGSVSHEYQMDLDWQGNGSGGSAPIHLNIYDLDYARNSGSLTVKLLQPLDLLSEQPIATVVVNASDPVGSLTPALIEGRRYRFEVSGGFVYYRYSSGGFHADAECSIIPSDFRFPDLTMNNNFADPNRFDGRPYQEGIDAQGVDQLDVYVIDQIEGENGRVNVGPVKWVPKLPGSGASSGWARECAADQGHTYTYTFTAGSTGPTLLKVFEGETNWYTDNAGVLTVKIFLLN